MQSGLANTVFSVHLLLHLIFKLCCSTSHEHLCQGKGGDRSAAGLYIRNRFAGNVISHNTTQ